MKNSQIQHFFIYAIIVTLGTLLYAHQNIEIYKLGYSINSDQKVLSYFLDHRKQLVYNLTRLKSPVALDKRLRMERIDLIEPDAECIYYAGAKSYGRPEAGQGIKGAGTMAKLFDILTVKAEARTERP